MQRNTDAKILSVTNHGCTRLSSVLCGAVGTSIVDNENVDGGYAGDLARNGADHRLNRDLFIERRYHKDTLVSRSGRRPLFVSASG